MRLATVRWILLLFWALWHTMAATTNVIELGRVHGRLRRAWSFASGNYRLLDEATARHRLHRGARETLFALAIIAEAVVAGLFWRAVALGRRDGGEVQAGNTAIGAALGLWGGFLIVDELLVTYETGVPAAHARMFIAQLATLLTLLWLPGHRTPARHR